ncbi:hypothetical protein OE88DRAFT_1714953 [Heliocybe sulcata]|uniref:CxC2-like cysteine cluster KDZ transposase-associated domain-containing protein n=1 Tax=Heliocybe sulcata TaxID=5364 RepID=A0A5C3MQV8_9AGAM|nr:hypothetical protein OE88DRAFT_1714953 [Heliocybe sulcata]
MKRHRDPPSRPKKLKVRIHEGASSTTSIEHLRYSKTKAGRFNQLSREVTVLAHPEDGSDQSSSAQESDWTDEEEPVLEFEHQEPEPKQCKKGGGTRYQNTQKLEEWLPLHDSFLDEILRLDGFGSSTSNCRSCGNEDSLYRCLDCFTRSLICQACVLTDHSLQPLHRIELWNGQHFEKHSLRSLGLTLQLGHDGAVCPYPADGVDDFLLIDVTGIHRVSVEYCGCQRTSLPKYAQLLRSSWFPASFKRPGTAFTFRLLNLFHQLTLQGKTNLYDFWLTLLRVTDNSSLASHSFHYKDFVRVMRLWRHLMMLKRAGRGHDPSLSSGTAQGELAVGCPACPHLNGNLPEEWEDADSSIAWLYALTLAIDANFRLKLKKRDLIDVELAPGWAYFVEESGYQRFLRSHIEESEVSTCQSRHDAIVRSATRHTEGYAVSGVGSSSCARHGLMRRNAAADLQVGEKYCTMDFLVLSTLIGTALLHLAFPVHMQLDHHKVQIRNVIPKFHVNAHDLPCQVSYNIAYIPHVGRLCGVSFRKKYLEAVRLSKKHEDLFVRFSATFPDATLRKWEKMVLRWEKDKRNPNPYAEDMSGTTLHSVRLQLSLEEQASDSSRRRAPQHKMTASQFLHSGLELEEEQRHIRLHIANLKAPLTAKEKADLQDKRSSLRRRVGMWRSIQALYMPCVAAQFLDGLTGLADDGNNIPEDDEDDEDDNATRARSETMPLHLPSGLPRSLRTTLPYQLDAKELRLRLAQAHDSLSEIRRQRRVLQGLTEFKKRNVSGTGQRANTRLRALYNRFNQKTRRAAERYRAARCALTDITGPGRGEEDVSKGRYEMSWIWHVGSNGGGVGEEGSDAGYHEGLRVEWAKSRARAQRWREEVQLLEEEMRRAVAYLEWKANWWRSQAYRRVDTGVPQDVQHGLAAYAFKQAGVMDGLAVQFASHWLPVLKANKVFPKWGEGHISRGQAACDTPGAVATSDCESSTVDGEEPHHDDSETEHLNNDYIDLDD